MQLSSCNQYKGGMPSLNKFNRAIELARIAKDWEQVSSLLRKLARDFPGTVLEELCNAELELVKEPPNAEAAEVHARKALELSGNQCLEAVVFVARALSKQGKDRDAMGILEQLDANLNVKTLSPRELSVILEGIIWRAEKLEAHHSKISKAIDVYHVVLALAEKAFPDLTLLDPVCKPCVERAMSKCASLGNTVEAIQALRKALRAPFGIKKELQVQALNDLAQTVLYMCPPARYPQMAPDAKGEFVPQSQEEEVILALLILEYLLSPPEQALERQISSRLVHDRQMWNQFFLSLLASRSAISIILERLSNEPGDIFMESFAAKIYLNNLDEPSKCIVHATNGLEIAKTLEVPSLLASRLHLMLGIAYGKSAFAAKSRDKRKDLRCDGLQHLHLALDLDPNDFQINYFIAVHLADLRQIDQALPYAREALEQNPSLGDAYVLLALLLSAKRDFSSAYAVVAEGLRNVPNHLRLLVTRGKLEIQDGNIKAAIKTYLSAFKYWGKFSDDQIELLFVIIQNDVFRTISSKVSATPLSSQDLAAAEVRSARTEVTLCSGYPDDLEPAKGPAAFLWASLASAFALLEQNEDAINCLREARALSLSTKSSLCDHLVSFSDLLSLEGDFIYSKNPEQAVALYQRALSIDPVHHDSLLAMAKQMFDKGDMAMMEHYLTTILRNTPDSHEAWKFMGLITKSRNDFEKASECFLTAINLEDSLPVMPFSYLQRRLLDIE